MSSFIQINALDFSFDNLNSPIISQASCSFHPGWTSICGPNGCGKTTLLKLIAGDLHPSSGTVQVHGNLLAIPQSTEHPPASLSEYRYDYTNSTIKLRTLLGIQEEWYDRWDSLSIGERKLLQLATTLASTPDILLVDEPTNHIDAPTRELVLQTLKKFRGLGILVSHDRLLLNQLCQRTAFLEGGKLTIFSANYDTAKNELQNQYSSAENEKQKLKKTQSQMAHKVQAQSEKIAQGKSKLSKRGINSKDHDAKERVNLARLTGADGADSRKKQTLNRKLEKITDNIAKIHTKKTQDLGIFFTNTPKPSTIHLKEGTFETNFASISHLEIILRTGDKLAITGANGAGKSTLLKHWLKTLPKPYAYGPQEFNLEQTKNLSQGLSNLDKQVRGKVMTLVSCFGSDPKALSSGSPPSPGVWQKLIIAQAIVKASPLLILDEPTNHMDLAAVEVLEEALAKYQGIIICITHDAEFTAQVCNLELHLKKTSKTDHSKTQGTLVYLK